MKRYHGRFRRAPYDGRMRARWWKRLREVRSLAKIFDEATRGAKFKVPLVTLTILRERLIGGIISLTSKSRSDVLDEMKRGIGDKHEPDKAIDRASSVADDLPCPAADEVADGRLNE